MQSTSPTRRGYLAGHNAAEKVCSSAARQSWRGLTTRWRLSRQPTKVSNSAVAIGLIVYGASVGSGGIHISHGDLADLADLASQSCAM